VAVPILAPRNWEASPPPPPTHPHCPLLGPGAPWGPGVEEGLAGAVDLEEGRGPGRPVRFVLRVLFQRLEEGGGGEESWGRNFLLPQ